MANPMMQQQSGNKPAYLLDKNEKDQDHQFTDSISDIKMKTMGQSQVYMAVSSWDGKVAVYMVNG